MPEEKLFKFFPEKIRHLLHAEGREFIKQVGLDTVRGIVLDVLCGKNIRDSTELLTRKKIAMINMGTFLMFLKGQANVPNFIEELLVKACSELKTTLPKDKKWLLEWILGLTDKGFQNILRDRTERLDVYKDRYMSICQDVISSYEEDYGILSGELKLTSGEKAEISWNFMIYLLETIGSQTLTIRGSEKSTYGKLFERLVLGSLLYILGFRLAEKPFSSNPNHLFWLASREEERRESDATALFELGKGIRFDIGFIGRGNPEISLDKVSSPCLPLKKQFLG